jgi:hypothetical protein
MGSAEGCSVCLLLLDGEIVNWALAQLTGAPLTAVTFSFGKTLLDVEYVRADGSSGWTSYAVNMLLARVGDTKSMLARRDGPVTVVTAKNGYIRENQSWVIDRIMGDYEARMDPAVKKRLNRMLDQRHKYMRKTPPGELRYHVPDKQVCVSLYMS